jgi:hypothetical protein
VCAASDAGLLPVQLLAWSVTALCVPRSRLPAAAAVSACAAVDELGPGQRHRRFLLDLSALRCVDSSVTVPYWDWTRDRTTSATPSSGCTTPSSTRKPGW